MSLEIGRTVLPVTPATSAARAVVAPSGSAFSALMDAVQSSDAGANSAVSGMLDGSVDVHDAMIALQRSDLTMQLSVQIRNKLVQAYQDIMRMPI